MKTNRLLTRLNDEEWLILANEIPELEVINMNDFDSYCQQSGFPYSRVAFMVSASMIKNPNRPFVFSDEYALFYQVGSIVRLLSCWSIADVKTFVFENYEDYIREHFSEGHVIKAFENDRLNERFKELEQEELENDV